MDTHPPPEGITADDWMATPVAVRQFLVGAVAVIAFQQQQIADLQATQAALLVRIADLEARLNQHSQNSSKPPSSDPPSAPPRPARTPRGRAAGGQPGHPPQTRPDPPPDQVDTVRDHFPDTCPRCHDSVVGRQDVCLPQTQYVWDVPIVRPHITAHH
jgi:transposase